MIEHIALLHDEVADYLAAQGKRRREPGPRFQITSQDVTRGYACIVEIDGTEVVNAFGRSLADAHRTAATEFRQWAEDQPAHIERALEASIAFARGEMT